MKKKDNEKLRKWQNLYKQALAKYQTELDEMDSREKLYAGSESIKQITCRDFKRETKHVRNITAEIIEAQVNSTIPQPKVTARRKADEHLATIIEDMLRNEINRLPFEVMNDINSRTVPIQGGAFYHVEWDESQRTPVTSGELCVSTRHPKSVIPQPGVTTSIEDMDYIFLEIPQTREYILQKYGIDVYRESEERPDIRGTEVEEAPEMVTQIICYFRNDKGGIGKFSWVGDKVIEDLDNYQKRRVRRCVKCGALEPLEAMENAIPKGDDMDPNLEEMRFLKATKPRSGSGKVVCPYCGASKWEEQENDFEELQEPLNLSDGSVIAPNDEWEEPTGTFDELTGREILKHRVEPRRIPYFEPNMYPIVLVKNTSIHGKFLGSSDVDFISYQQNTTNRLAAKVCDKLMKSGSYITLPPDARLKENGEDGKIIRLTKPNEKDYIGVFDMEASIAQDMEYMEHVYQEARQIIGVTDSFQGRNDPTATSGRAKEFAAAQSAGRLESKRVMRDSAFADMFRLMFLWKLAYADEPRPVVSQDAQGNTVYSEFNRYDFLRKDDAGNFYWLTDFIFSTDVTAPLANNRQAMWEETRANFQSGAFGPPEDPQTRIMYWGKMAQLHYPGAEDIKTELQEEYQRQQEMIAQQQAEQAEIQRQALEAARADAAAASQQAQPVQPAQQEDGMQLPDNMRMAIENMAREQAMKDAGIS